MIDKIENHEDQARDRMLEQYKDKPNMCKSVSNAALRVQELEDYAHPLLTERALANASGVQLDGVGELVGLKRPLGIPDDYYKLLIYAKIGINSSQGDIERIIAISNLATRATECHLQELFPAAIYISTNVEIIPSLVTLLATFINAVACAGISVDHAGFWPGDEAFAFDGAGSALGFSDANEVGSGGQLGGLYVA